MSILIKQAIVADPRSTWHAVQADILVKNGRIEAIDAVLDVTAETTIQKDGLHVAPGFTDIFSHFNDPGQEHKETLETGAAAAAAGGYTRVLVLPNTQPALHSKSQVEYILQKSKLMPVQILPFGAITRNCEGKELAEMYDMHQSGAVAFTDGIHPVQNSQVLLKALQYVKAFDGVVVQIPDETNLSRTGLMNEGIVSTQLGLPGKPVLAETLMLARDIELLRYTGSKLHVTGISTSESIQLVRRAKSEGLQLSCSVTPYHLSFSDDDLAGYDTNLKVNPPLRTLADVAALREAVLDGTVDCIASHHQPHEWDSKVCEFEYAQYGMEGLESCFGAVNAALPGISIKRLANLFSINACTIFGMPLPDIAPGEPANLTLWTSENKSPFTKELIASKGSNNAFINAVFPTAIAGTICNNQFIESSNLVHA